jgi:hypothetical protein
MRIEYLGVNNPTTACSEHGASQRYAYHKIQQNRCTVVDNLDSTTGRNLIGIVDGRGFATLAKSSNDGDQTVVHR